MLKGRFTMSALEWKNFKLDCCYLFSSLSLDLSFKKWVFTDNFCACDLYKIHHIAWFLLLLLNGQNCLKLHCCKVVQVPGIPSGIKIIFGIAESIEGFDLKLSVLKDYIQEIHRKLWKTKKENLLFHHNSTYWYYVYNTKVWTAEKWFLKDYNKSMLQSGG